MAIFSDELLIDPATGEIDLVYLAQSAEVCARSQYGEACTNSDVEFYAEKLGGRAYILRQRRRKELGLPDDQTYTTVFPFGRARDGVRYSAF